MRQAMPNHLRFRISPEMTLALGVTVMDEDDEEVGQQVELLASRRPGARRWMRTSACSATR